MIFDWCICYMFILDLAFIQVVPMWGTVEPKKGPGAGVRTPKGCFLQIMVVDQCWSVERLMMNVQKIPLDSCNDCIYLYTVPTFLHFGPLILFFFAKCIGKSTIVPWLNLQKGRVRYSPTKELATLRENQDETLGDDGVVNPSIRPYSPWN